MDNCSILRCQNIGYKTDKKDRLRCEEHCLNIVCLASSCLVQPTYNKIGETKGKYCYKHGKVLDMINVKVNKFPTNAQQLPVSNNIFSSISPYENKPLQDLKCTYGAGASLQNLSSQRDTGWGTHLATQTSDYDHTVCNSCPYFNYLGEPNGRYCMDHTVVFGN